MVLAAGCVKFEMDLAVNPDGSGSIEVYVDVAQEFFRFAGAFQEGDAEGSFQDVCREMLQGDDVEGTPLESPLFSGSNFLTEQEILADDSSCGIRARGEWPAEQAEQVFLYLGEDGGPTIERVGSQGWRFALPIDLTEDEDAEEFDVGPALVEALDFSLAFRVTLPGQSVAHNADSTRSGCDTTTFMWDVDIFDPPELLFSEADGEGDCGGRWGVGPIVAVVILGVVVAAMVAAIMSRRSLQRSFDQDSPISESPDLDPPELVEDA